MSWTQFLAKHEVSAHTTSRQELDNIRALNTIDYQNSSVATDTEAQELVRKAIEFRTLVEAWVQTNHRKLIP